MARPGRRPIANYRNLNPASTSKTTTSLRPPLGEPRPRLSLWPVGTNNLQPGARTGVDRETKAVQLYDRGHQIQAKTHARRVAHLVGAVETPEHGLAFRFTDAVAGVGHAHDGFAIASQQFNGHFPV